MTYVDNLKSFTYQTTPATPWSPPPPVICDFGWWDAVHLTTFGNLIYTVNGNTYPPAGAHFQDYILNLNATVTFDVSDTHSLGIPKTVVPPGVNVVQYSWDLGNGTVGQGPLITTSYNVQFPDAAATLTIVDSLGRQYSTTHRLNLVNLNLASGVLNRVVAYGVTR